jgi:hypothetical protein
VHPSRANEHIVHSICNNRFHETTIVLTMFFLNDDEPLFVVVDLIVVGTLVTHNQLSLTPLLIFLICGLHCSSFQSDMSKRLWG